jgi:hypothetical protein
MAIAHQEDTFTADVKKRMLTNSSRPTKIESIYISNTTSATILATIYIGSSTTSLVTEIETETSKIFVQKVSVPVKTTVQIIDGVTILNSLEFMDFVCDTTNGMSVRVTIG